MRTLHTLRIRYEHDVVLVRQRARQIACLLGFDGGEQTRIATAVSEIARNAFQYAGGGRAEFGVEGEPPDAFAVRIHDRGPGIADLEGVLNGRRRSITGMGLGIVGARRLVSRFEIESRSGGGTRVTLLRDLPESAQAVTPERLAEIASTMTRSEPQSPYEELQRQNQELLQALEALRERQSEIERLNLELEETNRGVVALYAELDERAQDLHRASRLKSEFLSNISHELRTPLNAILGISRLLAERTDGELTPEQEIQVGYIQQSAASLSQMVNELLDLARIEAGKTEVRISEFTVPQLFATLRVMFRSLVGTGVDLVFEDASALPPLVTDENRLSQILRNLVSNALKFTERGEVRVQAEAEGGQVRFRVKDTGIGIPADQQERIFEEFEQVGGPLRGRESGTGLGLPLSRKLAKLLGGTLTVASAPGEGATFTVTLPREWRAPDAGSDGVQA